ncbi:hypothetical protein KKD52_00850 [Myxococcota bacterium]|nr:hypothetical protein [Myxococcota bacterium]MBU1508878.1 hypothetical protein [Myxococcota bacterium]PKN27338.1 MAG: hypothetical protein CVU65_02755 [Deltaproteobacteria bacterium HGW-Deltaproteobacteria-22]
MGTLFSLFIATLVFNADPQMERLQLRLQPPQTTSAAELAAIMAMAPQARLVRAEGHVNVQAFLDSSNHWNADDGNIYFSEWKNTPRGSGWRVRPLLDSKYLYNTHLFLPADASQIGLNPDGTMVVLRGNKVVTYAPTGRLIRTVALPFTRSIEGIHSVGNGDLLVWSRNAMFYLKQGTRLAWRQVLDSNAKNAQYYGVAPFFTLELGNGLIEARRWSDGKRVWSHRLFAPGNQTSYYGFLADASYLILKGYQEAHVIAPDGRIRAVHRFAHRVQTLYLHQFRMGMYCFVDNNRLGYFNLETGRMEWLAELGSAPLTPGRMYNDYLTFQLQNRLVAFNADGRVIWSVRLPISPYVRDPANYKNPYTLIRMPGGNLAYVSQAGVYFIYPPSQLH